MAAAPEAGTSRTAPAAAGLPRFLFLYAALYAAYGSESAYMPAFLQGHGLAVERIGLVLAAGTAMRLAAGPAIGRLADHLGARDRALALAAGLSGIVGSAYAFAFGLVPLLLVGTAHAAATASLSPLSDALAVAASRRGRGFQYGWVRGTGSAVFVGGTLLSGQLIDRIGLDSIIVTSSALFVVAALAATLVGDPEGRAEPSAQGEPGAFRTLWRIPVYRRMIAFAFLSIGSHALNDGFAVISWREAGYGSGTISLLWSESVAAEVVVFLLVGPWLVERLGTARAAALSALAGILRWTVLGSSAALPALVGVQALHGLTFALMHLVAMGIIGRSVPERLSATAQTVYGTLALGIASAVLTFASGYLYGAFGLRAFYAMAALCVLALPLAAGLATEPARA